MGLCAPVPSCRSEKFRLDGPEALFLSHYPRIVFLSETQETGNIPLGNESLNLEVELSASPHQRLLPTRSDRSSDAT